MAYTVTSPQPAGLNPGETCVTLDSGQLVAIGATCSVATNSGATLIDAHAREITDAGQPVSNGMNGPIATALKYPAVAADVTLCGSMGAVQKCVLMALLGEPTTPMWTDPVHATFLANVSIRTYIASAAHAGVVDAGALL